MTTRFKVLDASGLVAEAHQSLNARERLIRSCNHQVKPPLDENVQFMEAGFQLGELNLIQVVTTHDEILKSLREHLEAGIACSRAAFGDVGRALGVRLAAIGTHGETTS